MELELHNFDGGKKKRNKSSGFSKVPEGSENGKEKGFFIIRWLLWLADGGRSQGVRCAEIKLIESESAQLESQRLSLIFISYVKI